jgi:hypothetical protein
LIVYAVARWSWKETALEVPGASARHCWRKVCQSSSLSFYMMLTTMIGREAVFLRDRVDVLKLRLLAVKSKQCATKKNKYQCPEVFLDAVADKLTTTADLFLDAELLSKFFYIVSPPLFFHDSDKTGPVLILLPVPS